MSEGALTRRKAALGVGVWLRTTGPSLRGRGRGGNLLSVWSLELVLLRGPEREE